MAVCLHWLNVCDMAITILFYDALLICQRLVGIHIEQTMWLDIFINIVCATRISICSCLLKLSAQQTELFVR